MSSPTVEVHPSALEASAALAAEISAAIRERAAEGKNLVLGLATGSTPLPLYAELIRLHREEGLSFANVISFNLDEYYGLRDDDAQSYHEFMRSNLFAHLDIPADQTHLPSGTVSREQVESHCAEYEAAIAAAGGLDLQILGIGRSGHVGFNEPPSSDETLTRLITLDPITIQDAGPGFGGVERVPTEAITMGMGTILNARRVVMMAWGESKAEILARTLTEAPSPQLPAAYLQNHPDVTILIDQAAATQLSNP
jgi:glucosamine-6-phosphate deaminase